MKLIDLCESVGDSVIRKEIKKLVKDVPDLGIANGICYCAFASKMLKDRLDELGIDSCIVVLRKMVGGKKCEEMIATAEKSFGLIPDGDRREEIREYAKKHKMTMNKIGHAVLLVGDIVYDVTSKQFGLPNVYPFSDIKDLFKTVKKDVKIDIKSIEQFGEV